MRETCGGAVGQKCGLARIVVLALLLGTWPPGIGAETASYKYFRAGSRRDIHTKPTAGIAMMWGGRDLDEAFRWLCNKGNGGLVARRHAAVLKGWRF
jgi:hypothetical protein